MDKVIFWGAGQHAEYLWNQISKYPYYQDEYIAFSDNNSELWGREFKGLKIIPPSELKQDSADFIVITSIYIEEIKRQLIDKLGFSIDRIYFFDEYERKCYAKWQYLKKYSDLLERCEEKVNFDLRKLVIYTAITGDYDVLREPSYENKDITYVCFTNNRNIKSDIWNIEYIYDNYLDNMHLAKKYKMHPDLYFKEFETSIWVDGKYEIEADFREYIKKYEQNKPILCFPHFKRECIYDEAAECICSKIGNKEGIIRQLSDYYQEGYPINNGLYEMGCIIRRHNEELVKKIMGDWAREIEQYSYRDQISFPYVCWKNNFEPDICDLDINRNQWLLQRRTLY